MFPQSISIAVPQIHTPCTMIQTFNHFFETAPQQLHDSQNSKQITNETRARGHEPWISWNNVGGKVRTCIEDERASPRAQVKWWQAAMHIR
jgi:hypothetical protein